MGCVASVPDEKANQSRIIDEQNAKDQELDRNVIKMLILGAGESGKSTLIKQMTTIYGAGFSTEEREKTKKDIFNNIIEAMRTLVLQSESPKLQEYDTKVVAVSSMLAKNFFLDLKEDQIVPITEESADLIATLWKDPNIQNTYQRRNLFQLPDSASYYFDRINEISRAGYLPSYDDVLRTRVRTTGAIQYNFVIGGSNFHVFDVGGQKSERKKWINCFENVTAVVFVAAISEYDQVMYEDNETNRLQESLTLFESISNTKYFEKTSMILFLNKTDLFETKIKKVSLSVCFVDFPKEHDGDSEFAKNFIAKEFQAKNSMPGKKDMYVHFTTAVSTDNMKNVLASTQSIILKASLEDGGIL